ncbi:MAG: primosomal protein N', partial [Alistipes sp.]|nr:primosomal protein N' [Alistipes sp.]
MNFADIILPLAQPCYTFAVSHIPDLKVGEAVAVQFGKSSVYTGIVLRLHNDPPKSGKVKPVLKRLYDFPLLSQTQIKFWSWLAEYYISTIGEVMRIALPSLVKPHAATEELYTPYTIPQQRVLRLKGTLTEEQFAKITRRAPRRAALITELQNS